MAYIKLQRVVLVFMTVLFLTACGGDGDDNVDVSNDSVANVDTETEVETDTETEVDTETETETGTETEVETGTETEAGTETGVGTNGVFDFGGVFDIETSDNCGTDTGTDTKDYVTIPNNTSRIQNGLTFFENINGNYILQSCNQKGTRTEWKQSSAFSLSEKRKIIYNAKFYDYPSAGVTIAQIHNRGGAGRPLLRVEIINGEIEFIIVDTYVKGEGSAHEVVGPEYEEGTYLDLSLETGGDEIIATVTTTKGTKTVVYTKNNSSDDYNINDNWYNTTVNNSNNGIYLDEGFYFKSGVYNDSGNNSDHPKAEFTSFKYEE